MGQNVKITLDPTLEKRFVDKCKSLEMDVEEVVNKLIERFIEGRSVLEEQEFADGLTVEEYLVLSEEEKDALWSKWEKVAEQNEEFAV